jgi:hypothetical protein
MINFKGCERKLACPILKYYHNILVEGVGEATDTLSGQLVSRHKFESLKNTQILGRKIYV